MLLEQAPSVFCPHPLRSLCYSHIHLPPECSRSQQSAPASLSVSLILLVLLCLQALRCIGFYANNTLTDCYILDPILSTLSELFHQILIATVHGLNKIYDSVISFL